MDDLFFLFVVVVEKLMQGQWGGVGGVCTVTVMVIRLVFHLESNIMMTLKLDMKHICKKDMRRKRRRRSY